MTLPALSTHPPLKIAAKYWHLELSMHLCALILLPPTSTITSVLISSRNILSKSSPSCVAGDPLSERSVDSVLYSKIEKRKLKKK